MKTYESEQTMRISLLTAKLLSAQTQKQATVSTPGQGSSSPK